MAFATLGLNVCVHEGECLNGKDSSVGAEAGERKNPNLLNFSAHATTHAIPEGDAKTHWTEEYDSLPFVFDVTQKRRRKFFCVERVYPTITIDLVHSPSTKRRQQNTK